MPYPTNYEIVTAATLEHLEIKVQHKLKHGWSPHGSPQKFDDLYNGTTTDTRYIQAMVKG